MNTQTKAVVATTALIAAASVGVYTSDYFASAPIGGTYQVDVTLDPLVIANPGTTECTMDFAGSPAVPAKASCTARSLVADEWESCSSTTPVGNVFTCTLKFESIYRPTGASFTEGDWIINHISAFAADGTTRLIAYHDALQGDGQDVDFILGPCTPTTCVAEGWDCGTPDDGCGTPLDCGEIDCGGAPGYYCGLVTNYVCGCDGLSCGALGYECGTPDDNCGDPLDCDTETGGCGVGDVCSDAPDYQCEAGTGGTGGTGGTAGAGGTAGTGGTGGAVACGSVTPPPDLSTDSDTWAASAAQTPADDTLVFSIYARSTTAGNAIVAVDDAIATTFGDNSMLIRFDSGGDFSAWDQRVGTYCNPTSSCDNTIPWIADTWYKLTFDVNILSARYSVTVGTCDETPVALVTDATFRTPLGGDVAYYNIWANTGTTVDVDSASWAPGTCVPETCASYECGSPSDGCGGTLSCGTCPTGGDVCYPEGTCCTPSATVCTDPDPDYECGDWPDGCGGTVNCDTDGLTCNERVPGEVCLQDGHCGAPVNFWEIYDKPNATNTGANPSSCPSNWLHGGTCPSATLLSGNAPPSSITQSGSTYENFTATGQITINADNVTLRNFIVNGNGENEGIRMPDGTQNALIEFGEIYGAENECLRGLGGTLRYLNVHGCADDMKAQANASSDLLVEHSYFWNPTGSHGDSVQSYEKQSSAIFRYNHLVGGTTSVFIMNEAPQGSETFLVRNNWLNGDGVHTTLIYCGGYGDGVYFDDNLLGDDFLSDPPIYQAATKPCCWRNNKWESDFSTIVHPNVPGDCSYPP